MDNNRKDIGQAIRNKLEGMQQQPSAGGWDKLRAELDSGKKKRGLYNWMWLLALLILVSAITLTYFTRPFSTENFKDTEINTPVETTLTDTYTTGPGTDTPGDEAHNTERRNSGGKNTMAGTAGVTTKPEGKTNTVNDASNMGTGGANANNMNTKSGKATAKVNSINPGSEKPTTDASGKNSKARQTNAAYNNTTNPPMPEGDAAPGQVSAPKKGRSGSIAAAGTLAYGPDKMGAITTGTDAAKERITGLQENNNVKAGMAGGTSKATVGNAGQHSVMAAVSGKKVLVKPKKVASKITATRGGNVAAQTAADKVQATLDKVTERVASTRDTLTAAEMSTLIASTATIIFTETLIKNDSTTVALVTDSLAHECNEKIEGIANPDDKIKDKSSDTPYKRYYAFAYAAPGQYVYNSGRSLIDGSLNGIKTETKTSVNYGAFLGYEATRHWGIRAGVLVSRLERNTRGAALDTLGGHQNYAGIKYIPGLNNNMLGDLFKGEPFSIIQKTDMLEVPLEVTYRLGGNKWSSKLIAGLSMVHVRTDNVFVQGGNYNVALGSLKDTKQTSFTAGFGAGLYYEVLPNLQINAEPFIKYHINTFGKGNYINTFNDSNPFSLSIRVGVQYNFDLFKK